MTVTGIEELVVPPPTPCPHPALHAVPTCVVAEGDATARKQAGVLNVLGAAAGLGR
jgi:hypothetical protein